MTEDILIGQTGDLEQFHWFVRAHLENSGGRLGDRGGHHGDPGGERGTRAAAAYAQEVLARIALSRGIKQTARRLSAA